MKRCRVTLSANSGISLQLGETTVLVDALHNEKHPPFSAISPALLKKVLSHSAFAGPDVFFCTHLHPDHYSRKLAVQLRQACPQVKIILPEREFSEQLLLTEPVQEWRFRDISFRFLQLPHESPKYAAVPHYGLLLKRDGFSAFVAGDCAVASPILEERLQGESVDLAILPFPWLSLPKGREFVRSVIRPKSLFLCHFPFAEEDRFCYQEATRRRAPQLPEVPDIRFLTEPLQSEEL